MNNQKQGLTEQDVSDLKVAMQSFMSDLQKLNEPSKQQKGCRWVSWKDPSTGMEVGEYQ